MPEFRVRVEFDVEVADPSHIDAAFAAADHLQELARENRFSYLVYEVAEHSVMHDGTQWKSVDLEEIQNVEDTYTIEKRMQDTASMVLAKPGTVTDTDRKNAAVRLAEMVLGIEKGQSNG